MEAIMNFTVNQLQARLNELRLNTRGLKPELQQRLRAYYEAQVNNQNNNDDGQARIEAEGNNQNNNDHDQARSEAGSDAQYVQASAHEHMYHSNPVFTLRDVEDSISHFTGSDTVDINRWINEFEDVADTVRWNDLQTYIYAKQLIKGAAKIFIRGSKNIHSWRDLKIALVEEFGKKQSSAEVRRALRNRKKQSKETLIEYLYSLIELGSNSVSEIDELSMIEYFVEGIPDSRTSKSMLFEARNIKELKEKITVYEKVKGSLVSQNYKQDNTNKFPPRPVDRASNDQRKCFKCGKNGHLIKDCKSEVVCFKCKGKGHYSYQCKASPAPVVKKECINTIADAKSGRLDMIFVEVNCCEVIFKALFDSGSQYFLLEWDVYKKFTL